MVSRHGMEMLTFSRITTCEPIFAFEPAQQNDAKLGRPRQRGLKEHRPRQRPERFLPRGRPPAIESAVVVDREIQMLK